MSFCTTFTSSPDGSIVAGRDKTSEPLLELTQKELDTFDIVTRTAAKMMIKNGKARLVEG